MWPAEKTFFECHQAKKFAHPSVKQPLINKTVLSENNIEDKKKKKPF